MDYTNYKVEDFICDESFQRYCHGKDEQDIQFWKKWKSDHPHLRFEIEEAEAFVLSLAQEQAESSGDPFDYKQRRQSIRNILVGKTQPRRTHKYLSFLVAACITVFICVLAAVLYYDGGTPQQEIALKYEEEINPPGRRSVLQFSDGSIVHLNSNSRLRYPVSFENQPTRDIVLEGEAFFEVVPDASKPFIVHTGNLKTTVLGTSFNVQAYHDIAPTVAVVTGKVMVANDSLPQPQSLFLKPGQGAKFSLADKKLSTFEFDPREFLSWKDDILLFDNDDEKEVIRKLENWYGVFIEPTGPSSKKWAYKGEFKNKNLKEVLTSIAFAMDFDFTIKGDSVLINHDKPNNLHPHE